MRSSEHGMSVNSRKCHTFFDEDDGPQPRLDHELRCGCMFQSAEPRKKRVEFFDPKFAALSHNSKHKHRPILLWQAIIGVESSILKSTERSYLTGMG